MGIFFRQLFLGEVISFRYIKRGVTDPMPLVMLLTENYQGYLHGLNMRYMNSKYAQQLYWFFSLPAEQQQQLMPLDRDFKEEQQKQIQQLYQQKKEEALQQQTGVIVKPQPGNAFGVSTWGPTQKQVQPATTQMVDKNVDERRLGEEAAKEAITQQEAQRMQQLEMMKRQAQMMDYLGNPYVFYHKYIKAMFGNSKNISMVYRKYDPSFIRNPRIVRGLERLYSGF